MKTSGTSQSLQPVPTEDTKPKRGSLIRRRSSTKSRKSSSVLPLVATKQELTPDVSITITEPTPSPEAPISKPPLHRQQSESTVVHVLVHRESEEYNVDDDGVETAEVIIVPDRPKSVAGMSSSDCIVSLAPDKPLQDS